MMISMSSNCGRAVSAVPDNETYCHGFWNFYSEPNGAVHEVVSIRVKNDDGVPLLTSSEEVPSAVVVVAADTCLLPRHITYVQDDASKGRVIYDFAQEAPMTYRSYSACLGEAVVILV